MKVRIICECKVCQGQGAEVPTGNLGGAQQGTKDYATTVHNLVQLAHSPIGRMGFPNITALP